MAAVTRVKGRHVSPTGYEVVDRVSYSEEVFPGEQLVYTGTMSGLYPVVSKAPITGITEADGIALQHYIAGETGDMGIQGEMDGFASMTAGTKLYPSTATAGGLDTTLITGAVYRVKAIRPGRIRYCFV